MADRFPLILNTSANQIQEIASGDTLDLSGTNIKGVGIITATNISGNIIAGAGTSNIVSGILTAVAADIDDFVDVGSNIQLGNAGVITATTFKGDGDFVELDVDGHTNLDNVNIAGVTTFSDDVTLNFGTGNDLQIFHENSSGDNLIKSTVGSNDRLRIQGESIDFRNSVGNTFKMTLHGSAVNLYQAGNVKLATTSTGVTVNGTVVATGADINGDLDVDGHTNLDNVSIAGITTMSGNLNIVNTSPFIDLTDTDHNSDYKFLNDNGTFKIQDMSNSNAVRYQLGADGKHYIYGDTAVMGSSNLTVGGNLSVGGVLTYEDVVNVDSVGIVTARSGVFIPDNNRLHIGNTSGTGDLQIYHNGTDSRIHSLTNTLSVRANQFDIRSYNVANYFINCTSSGAVELYRSNVKKLETLTTGISVTGRADISTGLAVGSSGVQNSNVASFKGGTQNQVNIAASSNSSWGLLLTQSEAGGSYHTSTNSPASGKPCAVVNVQNDALNFGTNNTMRWTIDHIGHFYPGGNGNLDIGKSGSQVRTFYATGAVIGVCTATSFSGDGSGLTNISVGLSTEQVTPSSNVATLDLTKDDHKIVASGTYTITCTGGTEAENHTLRIENSGTANVGFSSYFKFPSGGTPSLPTTNGAISLISFTVHKVGSVGIATVLLSGASVNYS